VALLLVLLAAVFLPLLDAEKPQLSVYSGHWDDLSELRNMATGLGLSSRALLSGPRALSDAHPASSVLVIMGVERAYSPEELGAIEAFARAGGNVLVADDFGHGGELMEALSGNWVGLQKECLRDLWFSKNPDFVKVRVRPNSSLGIPAVDLMLNRPSALRMDPAYVRSNARYVTNPEVLANASVHSWLDVNRDLVRDADEEESPYPVAAFFTMASGARVFMASDPGLFVNDMMDRACNREFALSVLMSLGRNRSTIIFDESRHAAEGAAAGAGSAAMRVAAGLSGNVAALFLAFLLSLLLSMYQYSGIPDPAPRRHQDVLGDPRLLHFRTPAVSPAEFQRLRVAIVEKVRLAYGMTPEEFYPAMLPRLGAMLSDPELKRFLDYESWPDVHAFAWAVQRAGSWAPRSTEPPRTPLASPREETEYTEVEVVEEAGALDVEGALYGESGGVKIWDPGNRRRAGAEADRILYGAPPGGAGRGPSVSGGGGQ
jgi:hypothetical protein